MQIGYTLPADNLNLFLAKRASFKCRGSPLNPLTRSKIYSQKANRISSTELTRTHLSNLEKVLQKQPDQPNPPDPEPIIGVSENGSPENRGMGLLEGFNLARIWPEMKAAEEMSPRNLNRLQRLLSKSPEYSPRNSLGSRWREYHGSIMEEEEEREQTETDHQTEKKKKSSFVIKIPSYQEVVESSQPKTTPSLFNPSTSFSQAFNFIKNSEFYIPPPAPASQPSDDVGSRENTESEAPSLSTSVATATAASSSSAQTAQSRNAILVSHRQKGNPLLKHIRNVRWIFAEVVCDYVLGQNTCALYLSLRYHLLHPDYLYYRIRELQKNFKLRVVLCHVDVEDVAKPLLEVTKTALLHDCTLLCGWSLEECGRYLETIKVYENKPADIIQGQMDSDYLSRLSHALTTIRHVNKTDVVTLGSTFGCLSNIMDASMEDLARCPGIGERKVKRLYEAFHEPFKRVVPNRPSVPETPVENNFEPHSINEGKEDEKEVENSSKRKKTEPALTIKSALSAAFAKHADKVNKKNNKSQLMKGEETSSGVEPKPNKGNSSKTDAS